MEKEILKKVTKTNRGENKVGVFGITKAKEYMYKYTIIGDFRAEN